MVLTFERISLIQNNNFFEKKYKKIASKPMKHNENVDTLVPTVVC